MIIRLEELLIWLRIIKEIDSIIGMFIITATIAVNIIHILNKIITIISIIIII